MGKGGWGLICSDPPGNLLDGGSLELPSSRAILEGGVPSRRKKRGGLEVAGLRGKKRRLGWTDHLAQAELIRCRGTHDR
jgi:hypothetical protein